MPIFPVIQPVKWAFCRLIEGQCCHPEVEFPMELCYTFEQQGGCLPMRDMDSLNQGWLFVHRPDCLPDSMPEDGERVNLPHTWNAVDGHDGHAIHIKSGDWSKGDLTQAPESQYDRGSCWYYRRFATPKQPLPGGRVYVEIPAAGQQASSMSTGRRPQSTRAAIPRSARTSPTCALRTGRICWRSTSAMRTASMSIPSTPTSPSTAGCTAA